MGKFSTPRVPIQTPMFDEQGLLTRTWVIFFERLGNWTEISGGLGPYIRVLLLKDLTVTDDCAEHQYIFLPPASEIGTGRRIVGVLKETITADLKVRFRNVTKATDMTITIPAATAVDEPVELDITDVEFADKDVIAPDILASDGTQNARGIAAITLEWEP